MRKFLIVLIFLGIVGCLGAMVFGVYTLQTKEQSNLKNGLDYSVLIRNTNGGQGTAVIFTNGSYVFAWTAAHCVTGCGRWVESIQNGKLTKEWIWDDVELIRMRNNGDRKTGYTSFYGKVIRYSELEDIALIQIYEDARFFKSAEFAPADYTPQQGMRVWHSGGFWGMPGIGSFSEGRIIVTGRLRAPLGEEDLIGPKVMDQVGLIAAPGSSGGPVFEKWSGRVVGLLTETINGTAGAYLIAPTRRMWDFAKRSNCEWALSHDIQVQDCCLNSLTEWGARGR